MASRHAGDIGVAGAWYRPAGICRRDGGGETACPGFLSWEQGREAEAAKHPVRSTGKLADPSLRQDLLERVKLDQQVRASFIAAGMGKGAMSQAKALQRVDTDNLAFLRQTLAHGAFPDQGRVGKDGLDALFLLIQHADGDPGLQRAQLPHLQVLYRRHEVAGQDVALLTDRIRVHMHQMQVYGTQTQIGNGKIVRDPIEDPPHLEQRRAAMGLMPMRVYQCMLRAMYFPPRAGAAAAGSPGKTG